MMAMMSDRVPVSRVAIAALVAGLTTCALTVLAYPDRFVAPDLLAQGVL